MPEPPLDTISHYRLISLLGRGAMGEVWLAEDTQLPRKVAIKLLSKRFDASEEAVQRLLREAQSTASIDHPAVVVIHETGEVDGVPFLVMQHLTGETLADRLQRGPLEVPEALDLATRIADALSEVHALGIVHRDLKPANIMLTPHGAKILDFGIASVKSLPTLTETDALVGTPATMSPEQVRGAQADNRSDLWALGVILYQSLSGQLPFSGATYESFFHQLLNVEPQPIGEICPSVSPELDFIVMKLLRKKVEHRYARAEDLLADLANCQREQLPATRTSASHSTSEEETSGNQSRRLAVLQFEVLSNEEDDSFLAAGLAEDLIVDLTRVGDLCVASRAEAAQYIDRSVPPRTIARELHVDFLITGTVRRLGNRARISAQLIRALDGYAVWAHRFDRTLEDIFDVQAEISEQIVAALQVALKPGESEMLQRPPTSNKEAYRLYLRGRKQLGRSRQENVAAERFLKEAIELDRQFALAHAALGECYANRGLWWWGGIEVADQAEACARCALDLEPGLVDAIKVEMMVARLRGNPAETLAAIERVLIINPEDDDVRELSAWGYMAMGHPEKALPILEVAKKSLLSLLTSCYEMLGRAADVVRARELYYEHLVDAVGRDSSAVFLRSRLSTVLVGRGNVEEGLEQARRSVALSPDDGRILYNAACAHALAGKPDEALGYLQRAVQELPTYIVDWPRRDPDLASLHDHPDFIRMIGSAPDSE